MGPFKIVTRAFIDFFSITSPTPEQEKRATIFICSLLALIVLMAGLTFAVVVMAFGHGGR